MEMHSENLSLFKVSEIYLLTWWMRGGAKKNRGQKCPKKDIKMAKKYLWKQSQVKPFLSTCLYVFFYLFCCYEQLKKLNVHWLTDQRLEKQITREINWSTLVVWGRGLLSTSNNQHLGPSVDRKDFSCIFSNLFDCYYDWGGSE